MRLLFSSMSCFLPLQLSRRKVVKGKGATGRREAPTVANHFRVSEGI